MTSAAELPPAIGRILEVDERPEPISWLVDGLICDKGLTAIAVSDASVRTSVGISIVRALLGGPNG